jgi:hypothetical protein
MGQLYNAVKLVQDRKKQYVINELQKLGIEVNDTMEYAELKRLLALARVRQGAR